MVRLKLRIANKKGKKEWVAAIKGKGGIGSDQNEREFEYDMPAVDPEVGMIIGFVSVKEQRRLDVLLG
jgi:hypothetical protein